MPLRLALLAIVLAPLSLPAQITFERTYGGTGYDRGRSVQQTSDSGYIIAGCTWSYGAGSADVYLIKTDANGDTLWTRTFGGANYDEGSSVLETSDHGYVIAGLTYSFVGLDNVYLIRTNASGDTLWTRIFGGRDWEEGHSVQQTTDGGYVIIGYTYSFGAGGSDVYLIKTNALGEMRWTKTYGDTGDEAGSSVREVPGIGLIIAGWTTSRGAGSQDLYLLMTDTYGETLWTRTYGGVRDDRAYSVDLSSDGGYFVTGYAGSSGGLVYLMKTDANGEPRWVRRFGTGGDEGRSVCATADGGCAVAGITWSMGAGRCDIYLVRVDAMGNTLWERAFGDAYEQYGYSVQPTSDGGLVTVGGTMPRVGCADIYVIKTSDDGQVAVEEPETPPTRTYGLSLSCYPNPASGSVTISLSPSIPLSLSALLRLFDASGRLVLSQPVRTSPFILHPSALPAGVYLARLDCGAVHATTRLVVQK